MHSVSFGPVISKISYFNEELKVFLNQNGWNIFPDKYYFLLPKVYQPEQYRQFAIDGIFPVLSDLTPAILYCIVLSIIRLALHHVLLKPISLNLMGLKLSTYTKDAILDRSISSKNFNNEEAIKSFSESHKRDPNEVRRYLAMRQRNEVIERKVVKFVEAFWRFLFYAVFCVVGYHVMFHPEPVDWVLDLHLCWTNYPFQPIPALMKFYYQVELGCYLHQLLWTEVNRSDALEMILHHFATISLIGLSYLENFVRIGCIIMLVHDVADVFLESAKVFNYVSKNRKWCWIAKPCCDVLFGVFALTFFFSRLVIYPIFPLYSVFVHCMNETFGWNWSGAYIFSGFLLVLQFLHIFWFYLIGKMIYRMITTGIEKDERSDDEEVTEIEDCSTKPKTQ